MADKTRIEWTEATWNPVTGCAKVSAGCKHCYAERDWARLQHLPAYAGRAFTDVATHADRLDQPLRWGRPRRIFVNSMSDLFHPDVPDAFIDCVFAVMALAKKHSFQVLTKRSERMRRYVNTLDIERLERAARTFGYTLTFEGVPIASLPLPNVWLGVSIEDQPTADERIPDLLETLAAIRWLSAEPLLGPVDLERVQWPQKHKVDVLRRGAWDLPGWHSGFTNHSDMNGIDWVVVGGESGRKARPMSPQWVQDIRDQCAAAGVPFMFKQWGEWLPMLGQAEGVPVRDKATTADGWVMGLAGKKAAGRRLDGELHDEYPVRQGAD